MSATLALSDSPQRLGPVVVACGLHLVAATALWGYLPSPDTRLTAVAEQMWIDLTPPDPQPPTKPQAQPLPRVLPKAEARAPAPSSTLATPAATPAVAATQAPLITTPAPNMVGPGSPLSVATPAAPVVTTPSFDAAYLNNPKPAYPMMARRLGEEGRVLLRVHVSAEGRAEKIDVLTGSGSERLDQAARDTVTRWRFLPARQGDEPIAAWVTVPIHFKLEQ